MGEGWRSFWALSSPTLFRVNSDCFQTFLSEFLVKLWLDYKPCNLSHCMVSKQLESCCRGKSKGHPLNNLSFLPTMKMVKEPQGW